MYLRIYNSERHRGIKITPSKNQQDKERNYDWQGEVASIKDLFATTWPQD